MQERVDQHNRHRSDHCDGGPDGIRGNDAGIRALRIPGESLLRGNAHTGGLKLFDIPYVLTNGGPGTATETVGTVIYRMAFNQDRFGYATAISVIFFIVIAFFSINQVRFTRKREVQL